MATIQDIAQKASVSITTVSRILNEDVTLKISDEKRKRVLEVAGELNYVCLKKKKKQAKKFKIAIVHCYHTQVEMLHPYFLQVRVEVEKQCVEAKIDFVRIDLEDIEFVKKTVDGVIAIGEFGVEEKTKIARISKQIIFVDASPKPIQYDSVNFDYEQGMFDVLDYFKKLGHTAIAYIGGSKYLRQTTTVSQDALGEIMRKQLIHQTGIREEWFLQGENTAESGYQMMKKILDKPIRPTAVFVASGLMCVGVYKALNERGQMVPGHISIIGIEDFGGEAYLLPALSVLKGDVEELAYVVVTTLLSGLKKRRKLPQQILIPMALEIRESCKVIPKF